MSKRWLLGTLGGLFVLGAAGYYPLVRQSPPPNASYKLDIARVRALGDSLPGDKAAAVRFEKVMDLQFSEAMLMAGDPWRSTPMPVYSYQLVFPQQTIVVDTALSLDIAKPGFMVSDYDDAAFSRMSAAMEKASLIVVTHEHMDHIGGIAVHPHLAQLLPALRLTVEQVANPKGMKPAELPPEVMKTYEPLRYQDLLAIAPGVVLIKAPGHTPGSQMVYVKRADGRELLFLGDVSWRLRNIEQLRERPLFMTLIIGENRTQVLGEFQALHDLAQREPKLAQVPGHDGPAVDALASAGLLQAGFQ